jgi:hypothetical protein
MLGHEVCILNYVNPIMNVDVAVQDTATTFRQSAGLSAFLAAQGVSILFSSYQSGYLYTLRHSADDDGAVPQFALGQPLDICVNDGARAAALFATELPHYSYRGPWRPPFIPALVDEDRCQINGLAMEDGQPAYVTAVIRSDTIDGWLDREYHGGVVIDARTGKSVCEGLSKPHAPRLHKGELWVLNSGTGELGVVAGAASNHACFVRALRASWSSIVTLLLSACPSRASGPWKALPSIKSCTMLQATLGAGSRLLTWRKASAQSGSALMVLLRKFSTLR